MALCVIELEAKDSNRLGIHSVARQNNVHECGNRRAVCEEVNVPGGNEPKKAKQRKEECKECRQYCLEQRDNLSSTWTQFYSYMGETGMFCKLIEQEQRYVEITELSAECPAAFYPENSTPNVYAMSVGNCVRCVALISEELQQIDYPSASYTAANNAVARCTNDWIRFCTWLRAFVPFSDPRPAWTAVYNVVCPAQQFGPVPS